MRGLVVGQGLAVQLAGVEAHELAAVAVEHVVLRGPRRLRAVRLAELLRVHVPDVVAGRGQAPGVVLGPADQDVHREAGHGRALGLDPGAVQVDLLDDLRVVVAELRPHHGQVVAGLRAPARGEQPVRGLLAGRGGARGRIQSRPGCVRVPRVDGLDRPGVDRHGALDRPAGDRRVVEALLDRGRRLGVIGQHHVVPGLVALRVAELLAQLGEQLAVQGLAAPARAEDRPDERRHRDHVVDRGRRLVDVVRLPVGVDAVGVRPRIGDDLPPLGAVGVDQELALLGDQRLRLRARHERLQARHQAEGVDVGDVGDRGPGGAPAELDQEPAVPRRGPARSEREVLAGVAVDVRDPPLVVDDADAGPPRLLLVGLPDRLEVLGQEELVDVGVGDVVAKRRQAGVQGQLIGRVLRERNAAVVARRQDVVRAVLRLASAARRGSRQGGRDRDGGDRCDDEPKPMTH